MRARRTGRWCLHPAAFSPMPIESPGACIDRDRPITIPAKYRYATLLKSCIDSVSIVMYDVMQLNRRRRRRRR